MRSWVPSLAPKKGEKKETEKKEEIRCTSEMVCMG